MVIGHQKIHSFWREQTYFEKRKYKGAKFLQCCVRKLIEKEELKDWIELNISSRKKKLFYIFNITFMKVIFGDHHKGVNVNDSEKEELKIFVIWNQIILVVFIKDFQTNPFHSFRYNMKVNRKIFHLFFAMKSTKKYENKFLQKKPFWMYEKKFYLFFCSAMFIERIRIWIFFVSDKNEDNEDIQHWKEENFAFFFGSKIGHTKSLKGHYKINKTQLFLLLS